MSKTAALTVRRALSYAGPMQRLSGGRVNQVWQIGDRVAKLFNAQNATPLFPNSAAQEWSALLHLRGTHIAPDPVALLDTSDGPLLVYRHIPEQKRPAPAPEIARLLGRLHAVTPNADMSRAATGGNVLKQGDQMIGATDPLHHHRPLAPPDPASLAFIHRDPVPANVVNGPNGPVLVDFQCPAIGDPAEDLAHFISPAMQILYGNGPLSSNAIMAFLDAYPNQNIAEHYHAAAAAIHWRMACYCQWQVDRGEAAYRHPRDAEIAYLSRL